ncbi:hypothetical protein HFN68_02610 [Rhizobium laguerreae]|uniref:hypothetical protein n=1 Tax=Rhizobium laguerreae TaxID=1076926 RepID=UPI001C91E925|nr:hypothetical protein [Rhizobium laguerreae]MBY3531840.1 hypothetical protein [Rhizobium laguerreae]
MNQRTRTASFATWKMLSPVTEMADRLGFDIEQCIDWEEYGDRFRAANDKDEGHMVKSARDLFTGLSTGERPVLAAMLHAADFSWLADELSGQETWTRLSRTYGDHAAAVALAIMRP